jgi:group I intron endonuclease
MKKRAYIYRITNTKNNKIYVGTTAYANPIKRWKKHILISKNKELYLTNGSFRSLHQAILDDGVGSFGFDILEECLPSQAFKREKYWIKRLGSFGENGYNHTAGGRGFNGRTHSEETKEKLSSINKGKFSGSDNPMYGKQHSAETRAKISAANRKTIFNRGKNNPFYGRRHSEETIAIMKEKAQARPYEKEWAQKHTKLSKEDVIEIKKLYETRTKVKELALKYSVSVPCIYKVLKNPRWTDQE